MTTRKRKTAGRAAGRKAGRQSGRAVPRRAGGAARTARRGAADGRVLRAHDLMSRSPIVVRADTTISELCDLLQVQNINGAPVVDAEGGLLGVVTQEDIIYGTMGSGMGSKDQPPKGRGERAGRRVVALLKGQLRAVPPSPPVPGTRPFWADAPKAVDPMEMPVSSIMTAPAIAAEEDTPVTELCRLMWSLRIHRLPILRQGKVTGLVSSMDLCRAILEGKIRI